MNFKLFRPFGPSIGEFKLDLSFINEINDYIDNNLLNDEQKRKNLNASDGLVGKVSEELYIEKEFQEKKLIKPLTQLIHSYLLNNKYNKHKSISLTECWVVRQFADEYNPVHSHTSHISGVFYLKVPEDKVHRKDGSITFINSPNFFLNNGHITLEPKVGILYLFPSYLLHTVYPIRKNKEERRSCAFNVNILPSPYSE